MNNHHSPLSSIVIIIFILGFTILGQMHSLVGIIHTRAISIFLGRFIIGFKPNEIPIVDDYITSLLSVYPRLLGWFIIGFKPD